MREVNEPEFVEAVLEASRKRAVVVDFWSPHCPPCHVLAPVLESLEHESGGNWQLVKINVDDNPQLADDYRVMSIPAVKAFIDGEVVDAFVGAWPRNRLQEWLADIVPSEADQKLRSARNAEEAGDLATAEADYAAIVNAQPTRYEAWLGLGRIALANQDFEQARGHLEQVPEHAWPDTDGRAEAIWLRLAAATLQPRDGDEPQARYERGITLAAIGQFDEALTELLSLVKADSDWQDGQAGRAMIRVIASLGPRDPRAELWRTRLGRALYA